MLALSGCSLPKLSYDNAQWLLRLRLYDFFEPDQQQDELMSRGLARLHAWHRQHELPHYAAAFAGLAERVERGLEASDLTWLRDTTTTRYQALAAQAVTEALPTLRTFDEGDFAALTHKLAERNDEYVSELLSGDEAPQQRAQTERLVEHLERWTGTLNPAQRALLAQHVAAHPDFARARLENRRHLQQLSTALIRRIARGDGEAEGQLRELAIHWERFSLPQYRQMLRNAGQSLQQTLLQLDTQLSAEQRTRVVEKLREYASLATTAALQ